MILKPRVFPLCWLPGSGPGYLEYMCRHLLNAKVAIQATCCKGWFECQECHDEQVPDHEVVFGDRLVSDGD